MSASCWMAAASYMAEHPGVVVEQIYKETEELRSGFIVAAIAGQGPDLVYGPSDQVGPFQVMGIIEPLEPSSTRHISTR